MIPSSTNIMLYWIAVFAVYTIVLLATFTGMILYEGSQPISVARIYQIASETVVPSAILAAPCTVVEFFLKCYFHPMRV